VEQFIEQLDTREELPPHAFCVDAVKSA